MFTSSEALGYLPACVCVCVCASHNIWFAVNSIANVLREGMVPAVLNYAVYKLHSLTSTIPPGGGQQWVTVWASRSPWTQNVINFKNPFLPPDKRLQGTEGLSSPQTQCSARRHLLLPQSLVGHYSCWPERHTWHVHTSRRHAQQKDNAQNWDFYHEAKRPAVVFVWGSNLWPFGTALSSVLICLRLFCGQLLNPARGAFTGSIHNIQLQLWIFLYIFF